MQQSAQTAEARIAELEKAVSRLRHDLRGALSPALLMADRLIGNTDPGVKRAGEVIVRAIERVSDLLDATKEYAPPRSSGTGGTLG